MTDEEIFDLAERHGWQDDFGRWNFKDDGLIKFALALLKAEREACAEICDGISEWYETRTDLNQTQKQVGQLAAEVCGVRIRERGEK
jgi:hypothetical protein